MSERSAIEWTATQNADGSVTPGATWNPVLGCSKVSAGCRGCYAIPQAWMKQHNPNEKVREAYAGLVEKRPDGSLNWTGRVNLVPERLVMPVKWKTPKRVFVNSLSDLFHEQVPDEYIDRVFAVMALAQQHTFQVLTKRPERMAAYLADAERAHAIGASAVIVADDLEMEWDLHYSWDRRIEGIPCWPLPNVWLGTSTEDQRTADERIPHLLETPAVVRFLSAEPLLGPVDLRQVRYDNLVDIDALRGHHGVSRPLLGSNPRIDWVIVGGESGPNARPLDLDWARGLRDQCVAAGVAFHFKQVGGRTPKAGGRELDGRTWDQFPSAAVPA